MCGNRSLEDLQIATASGADLLGIIFADAWRRIAVEKAAVEVIEAEGDAKPEDATPTE